MPCHCQLYTRCTCSAHWVVICLTNSILYCDLGPTLYTCIPEVTSMCYNMHIASLLDGIISIENNCKVLMYTGKVPRRAC